MKTGYKCPNCTRQTSPKFFSRSFGIWSKWRCETCGSLVRIDKGRRVLLACANGAIFMTLITLLKLIEPPKFLIMPIASICMGIMLVWAAVWMRSERLQIVERGDAYCGDCGYNLRGNTSRICPECGTSIPERDDDVLAFRHL